MQSLSSLNIIKTSQSARQISQINTHQTDRKSQLQNQNFYKISKQR